MNKEELWKNLGLPVLPSRKLFVLAEATPENQLWMQIQFHEIRHFCLLENTEQDPELASCAPYLLEDLSPEFDCWLTAHTDSIPHSIIQTTLAFDNLATHLKGFCRIFDAQKERVYYFRLGDSPSFYTLLHAFSGNHKAITKLFASGQIDGFLFQSPKNNLLHYARLNYGPIYGADYREDRYLLWLTPVDATKNCAQEMA